MENIPEEIAPQPQTRFKSKLLFFIIPVLIISAVIIFLSKNTNNPQTQPTVKPAITTTPAISVDRKETAVNIDTGFSFVVPNDWTSKISTQSKQGFTARFFLPSSNPEISYIEIESAAGSKASVNPLLKINSTKTEMINGLNVVIDSGQESFADSKRLIKSVVLTSNNNYFIKATLYYTENDTVVGLFDSFIRSIKSPAQQKTGLKLIKEIQAAEAIAGFAKTGFQKITVMGNPLPERIASSDASFKDGYAKLYFFTAFKGQRLTTVAMEDRTTNPNSFIRTELYAENGQLIDSLDTRIEFETPYTGTYYYIVRSFNYQTGGFLLKIFDRNQTENLIYVKYSDGSEKFVDPAKPQPLYGQKSVAFIIQFTNPIEVVDNSHVRYFIKPREFEPGLGLTTSQIEIFGKKESYADFLTPGTSLPEENPQNKLPIKITKLSLDKIIIEPTTGKMFPEGYNLAILEKSLGSSRILTQNDTPNITPNPISYIPPVIAGPTAVLINTITPPPPAQLPRTLRDTRERLFALGGNTGSNAGHIDSTSPNVEVYDSKTGLWQTSAPMIFRHVWSTAATLGNKIYVFGPATIERTNFIKAEVYDGSTNQWKEIASPPDPHTNAMGFNAFPWGSKIYLIMPNYEENNMKTVVYAYDIASNTYQKLSSPEKDVKYCGEYFAKIYCFRRDDLTTTYIYTPKNDSWEKVSIENRIRIQDQIVGDEIGLFAPSKDYNGAFNIFSFDISAAKFIPSSSYFPEITQKQLFGLSMGAFGSGVIIAGGMTSNYEAQKEVYIYDPAYGLTKLAPMILGRANFTTALLPLSPSTPGAVISGKISENGNPITTKARISLYKITQKLENGSQYTSLVASQNMDPDGQFAFFGLEPGKYELYTGGDYNSYSNKNYQNPITLSENQKLEDLEITAFK